MDLVLKSVPHAAQQQVKALLEHYPIAIKITKHRLTKHGDFRMNPNGTTSITINASTNPYRFLITLLHELAHFKVFLKYGKRARPHGLEWKLAFRTLLLPFLQPNIFPDDLCSVLARHMKNPKASSDRDYNLFKALQHWDEESEPVPCVNDLHEGQTFRLENGRRFVKIKKRRVLIECKEIKTGRIYLFSPHAGIIPE